ncbi:hypothetical protein L208DRAFT_1320473 [Tricholoma matsutake]|nr:hypothetical protein L208DRAFT_1320473 [Tricholoma matsutake 945]
MVGSFNCVLHKGSILFYSFRAIPTFGTDTICCFGTNASEIKKFAAHDYEDLLQCAIAAFEGLLEEPHNKWFMKLLYQTAEWHALAKARMHTNSSLTPLENLTIEFGQLMHNFCDLTCSQFGTKELPREATAHIRRQAQQKVAAANKNAPPSNSVPPASLLKTLNIFTYKFHALGDYVCSIHVFGTTDSYSTQLVNSSLRSALL